MYQFVPIEKNVLTLNSYSIIMYTYPRYTIEKRKKKMEKTVKITLQEFNRLWNEMQKEMYEEDPTMFISEPENVSIEEMRNWSRKHWATCGAPFDWYTTVIITDMFITDIHGNKHNVVLN